MGFFVGTDEAGYGPNLGPLVISATVWETPDDCDEAGLEALAAQAIARALETGNKANRVLPELLVIADSKALYKPAAGLRLLEQHFLTAVAIWRRRPTSWVDCWRLLAPEACELLGGAPWYEDFDEALPWEADGAAIDQLAATTASALAAAGIRLAALRARVIFPDEFNDLIDQHGSKGEALSAQTLRLLASMLEPLERGPIRVACDKHGGRNRYGRHLQECFPDVLIENFGEGREASIYRFGPQQRRVEIGFRARGEALLPTALASMCSKYLRELSMRPFNRFWRRHVPDLRPTAGYPGDARRFKDAIAVAQADLGIDDRCLWRER